MARTVAVRLLGGLASIVGASILAFVFLRLLPSDPARLLLGPLAPQSAVVQLRHDMGLDQGIPGQYWAYVSDFFRGDWGYSYFAGQPVRQQIGDRLPASLELGLWGLGIALVAAVLLALLTTYRKRPVLETATRTAAFVGLGTPPFWLGLVGLVVFVSWLGVLPGPDGRVSPDLALPPKVTGLLTVDALLAGDLPVFWNAAQHLLLPALVIAIGSFAFLVRLLQANIRDVSREPFLLVVRARGVSRWSAFSRHALPNAALPTLTASGLLLAQLVAGSVLVETIFNWPGVGELVVTSTLNQDYSVVQAFVLLSACAYVLVNLAIDLLAGVLDPRTRTGAAPR